MDKDKGQALILVVSILAVAGIMAVSFAFTMQLELKSATNYLEAKRATYLAEGGISYGEAILREDDKGIDSFEDRWHTTFTGSDVDNDGDGIPDSRWINMTDDAGGIIGRYAILIRDETSFLDINYAYKCNLSPLKITEGWDVYEFDLKKFLSCFGLEDPERAYEDIIDYRYGPDREPGIRHIDDNQNQRILDYDGIDNNGDGIIDESGEGIDEPMEFIPQGPLGDDRPFETPFEISKAVSLPKETIKKLYSYITTYSNNRNTDVKGRFRNNINTIDSQSLLVLLEDAGVTNPFQKAVNIIDSCDEDFSQSTITKLYNRLSAINRGPVGDWIWRGDHYESDVKNGSPYTITWINLPEGEYYIGVFGVKDEFVGDVTINGMTQRSVRHGEILRIGAIAFEDRILNLEIRNNEDGKVCYFAYLELYPKHGEKSTGFLSTQVYGVEGIRINEIMVRPCITKNTFMNQKPGGDWSWQNGYYQNNRHEGGKQGEGSFVWEDVPNGKYYVRLYAGVSGGYIGDVEIDTFRTKGMMDGDLFGNGKVITISNNKLIINIQNNQASGSISFRCAELRQSPDAEYIELINLTPQEVNLSGWTIEGPSKEGWPATIPFGTAIEPYEHLVLCVDKDDSQSGIDNNGISFVSIWGKGRATTLHFLRSITPLSDLLSDAPHPGGNIITLKDPMGHIVDRQEYFVGAVIESKSLEKSDPSYIIDSNYNSIPDNWYISKAKTGATPGLPNDNDGMKEKIGDEIIEHYVTEVRVKNKNFSSPGEVGFVPIGIDDWQTIPIEDVAKISDRLTIYDIRLEAEGHLVKGLEGEWREVQRASPFTDWCESGMPGSIGIWKWSVKDGYYKLRVYGEENEAIAVSIHLRDGSWSDWTPALNPGPSKGVLVGDIEIGTGSVFSTPSGELELKIKNVSLTGACHFDFIRLDPVNILEGRININTAPKKVLLTIPGIDSALSDNIIGNRPFGNRKGLYLGVGDILDANILGSLESEKKMHFKQVVNLISLHSDSYRIIVTAQILEKGKVVAEKKIWTVFER